jgi:predicted nucleotide-binding protein (sugar kinase/HSP70/actin superfamily)
MEKNEGFKITLPMLTDAIRAVIYGDLLMRCLYKVRPYEKESGSANALHASLREICIDSLINKKTKYKYKEVCKKIVEAFDTLPIDETISKPKVGIVGEILVKYMPLANNHLVELLESEGAEAVCPDLIDFFNYSFYNNYYKTEFLGHKKSLKYITTALLGIIKHARGPAVEALTKSARFEPPAKIEDIAEYTKPFLSLGNQYGEGWFLAGEMIELIKSGVPNIVCIQPFACLPNHVVGKGVIKKLRQSFPEANIAAVDYDPGASEVNQLNRIKLMLSVARRDER